MALNNKGLGRGLEALFNSSSNSETVLHDPNTPYMQIPIDALEPNPNQARETFAEEPLQELADSIREQGILQPILVRPISQNGHYQIIAGERRWRAAQLAGLATVPAISRDLDDNTSLIISLMENIQREDLNLIERARGLAKLKDALGVNVVELADKIGQGSKHIANQLRLLKLPPAIQEDIANNRIIFSQARPLITFTDPEAVEVLRQRILEKGLRGDEIESAIRFWRTEKRFPWEKATHDKQPPRDPGILNLNKVLGATLNCRTKISGSIEKGKISLSYESNEQFYEILEKLGISMDSLTNMPDN